MTDATGPNEPAARPMLRLADTGATFDQQAPLPEAGPVLEVQESQGMFAPPPAQPEGELEIIPYATRAAMIAANPGRAIRSSLLAGKVKRGTLFRV
ncbi:MAG: hypothetical protein NTW19_11940 [Planctomycetota bacterium]|nr:hypothetical protein [Planctomycetota bacterium]